MDRFRMRCDRTVHGQGTPQSLPNRCDRGCRIDRAVRFCGPISAGCGTLLSAAPARSKLLLMNNPLLALLRAAARFGAIVTSLAMPLVAQTPAPSTTTSEPKKEKP